MVTYFYPLRRPHMFKPKLSCKKNMFLFTYVLSVYAKMPLLKLSYLLSYTTNHVKSLDTHAKYQLTSKPIPRTPHL